MSRATIERRLFEAAQRLKRAREELSVLDEQLEVFVETAEDAHVRALVAETPMAHREYAEAQRHADAMQRSRQALAAEVAELLRSQDELLDRLLSTADGRT